MRSLSINIPRAFAPLLEKSRYKGAYGGRGSRKSHNFAEMVVERCILKSGTRWVCVREVQKTLKDSAKRLIETKIEHFGLSDEFRILTNEIRTPGDGIIIFQGLQDHTAESIKSLEGFDGAWVEEAQTMSARSLELLRPTIRKQDSELWFSWNPRTAQDPVDKFFRSGNPPPDSICISVNYWDNPDFPAELELERRHDLENNRERYAHIWRGEYEPMAIGAIWLRHWFGEQRRTRNEIPEIRRIVVGIDPNISSEVGADEAGIVVAGIGEDSRGYVLDDATVKGGPEKWARRAVEKYDQWDADAVVVERNQGGDMCRMTLRTVRPGLPIVEVTATRGKHVRAEPIAALYSTGRVSHVGTFPELEDQLCLITAGGYEGDGSPDRADALIWTLTELFPALVKKTQKPVNPKIIPNYQNDAWANL